MSTNRSNGSDDPTSPSSTSVADGGVDQVQPRYAFGGNEGSGYSAPNQGGGPGGSRRKRRRQRPQRGGKRPHAPEQHRGSHAARVDTGSRERIFQDVEGLLRQIREQADEAAVWSEEQLRDFVQTVTTFTKSLEQEADPISDRARSEYHRVREKLSQALRGAAQGISQAQ